MIGSLRGQVLDRDAALERSAAGEVLIEVAGIGYRVSVTTGTLERLRVGEEAFLHVHHHIREADQKLYGFTTKEERVAFEGLLGAHGVGPALALAVLATHPAPRLARILADDDLTALCEVPGVGKKTAQRLLVELRSSLVLPVLDDEVGVGASGNGSGLGEPTALHDVGEALANLGYSAEEVRRALRGIAEEAADPEVDPGRLLRSALRAMGSS